MTKHISVKELRMNFPKIVKQLDQGHKFVIIYRSKPIANLIPIKLKLYSKPFGEIEVDDKKADIPKDLGDYLKNIEKYRFKGGKHFDAVKLIRKDRGYDD